MRTLVQKNVYILIFCWGVAMVASACNALPVTPPVSSYTPALKITSTFAPIQTSTPAAPVICFVTYTDPIAFMPDGARILVRAKSGVQIFNLQTMKEEAFLEAPANLSGPAALSPDGEMLAYALEDHRIELVRISDKKVLHTLSGHTDVVTKLKFSATGDRLFSASHDTRIKIWDMSGELIYTFQPSEADNTPSEVVGMGLSPDDSKLGIVPADGPVKIWDLDSYTILRELGGSGGYDTADIVFSPDGQFVAADLATGLFLWKVSDGTRLLGGNPGINSMAVAFSPNGRFFVYSDIDESNKIFLSSPDGAYTLNTLEGHQAPVFKLIFSPNGALLASADDLNIRIWQVDDGKLLYIGKSECP